MKDKLTFTQLLEKWKEYWQKLSHNQVKNASLVPDGDSSVLFTTAGMQPLVPYLLGKPHPLGTRLFSVQKCLRTNDIEDVGDNRHLTSFHMLGNWSLGDYFRTESIKYSYEFLTNPKWLGISPDKLSVTVFEGDENAPRDNESAKLWESLGIAKDHIYYFPKKENWWAAGETGPCGPDTEIFYDTGKPACGKTCSPACDCGKYVEIWNNVFMEYNVQSPGTKPVKLPKQNVDTGMGAERVIAVLGGFNTVFETDCFSEAVKILESLSALGGDIRGYDTATHKNYRIIADHLRTAVLLLGDDVPTTPGNTGRAYILRRLIRRAVMYAKPLGIKPKDLTLLIEHYIELYSGLYPELLKRKEFIISEYSKEEISFSKTIDNGTKEFAFIAAITKNSKDKKKEIAGRDAFRLYDTFGFPPELTQEFAKECGLTVDMEGFKMAFAEHQEKSRTGSGELFKGGVMEAKSADDEVKLARLHSATHLLLAALRRVVGDYVEQRGSNITAERLRFDFLCDHKLTEEELNATEKLVNDYIKADAEIVCQEMPLAEAKASGAIGIFNEKYGDKVTVYTMGDFSKEFCGGPHAKRTGELGTFKILKEESSSSGVRRIKAELINNNK